MNEILFFGVCAFGANGITSYLLFQLIGWKQKGWNLFLALIANALLLTISCFFYYPYGKAFAVVLDMLILSALIKDSDKRNLSSLLAFSIVLGICEFITYPIQLYVTLYINRVPVMNIWSMSISMLFPQFLILYVYWLYRRLSLKTREKTSLFTSVLQIIILPIFTVINNIVMIMMSAYYMDPMMLMFILMDMIFVVFLNIYLCYLFERMKENVKLKQQTIRLEEMAKMQYTYYQKLEDKYHQSRGMIHDMKRHLQVLESGELPVEHLKTYLGDMKEVLHQFSHEIYSSHPIVNVILHEKFEEARNKGIQVLCHMAPVDFTFMREIDLTVIFANLLDNAIEACEEVQGERRIELKVDQVHEFIVIVIRNTSKPYPQTKRSSKEGHSGLGLKNVSQSIENYGGNIQVEAGECEFTIHLYLPMI